MPGPLKLFAPTFAERLSLFPPSMGTDLALRIVTIGDPIKADPDHRLRCRGPPQCPTSAKGDDTECVHTFSTYVSGRRASK